MKALTLWQPWSSLIAIGAKRIETRSWHSSYVGPLAIHAAQTQAHAYFALSEPMWGAFQESELELSLDDDGLGLPYGAVVAVARLSVCVQITSGNRPDPPELEFGDFALGRFAWHLKDVHRLPKPIKARGYPGLWSWSAPDWIMEKIA